MSASAHKRANIVIIGAGIAGLQTARLLVEAGFDNILVIEKSNRVGGRIHTIRGTYKSTPYSYEAGAGRISSNHIRAIKLIKELGLNLDPITANYTYQDVHTGKVIAGRQVYNELMQRVFAIARNLSHAKLKKMSFKDLCTIAIGTTDWKLAKSMFGYNAEFEIVNAYDGLRMFTQDFSGNSHYFIVREGLDAVTTRIYDFLRHSGKVHFRKNCTVTKVDYSSDSYDVKISMSGSITPVYADKVICALPKPALLQLFPTPQEQALLNSVATVSLNRIYDFMDPSWLTGRGITTSNSQIRQFIPIYSDIGLAMISYSDTKDADYWNKVSQPKIKLQKDLIQLFGDVTLVPNHIKQYYWDAGVHMWLPGYDSQHMSKDVMFIKGRDAPVYVVGEAYSMEQGWIEGSLQTVETLMSSVFLQKNK
jgi:predicted NAD/FAD-dependent oxidoreductase